MNRSRTVRLLVGSLVLLLAFAAACLVIRRLFPFPEIPNVHAKLAYFREHQNDYDTLFVGSSRINHQIIPAMFDQLSQTAGLPTKSFNAGVAGMRPPEDAYFFDQLLAARPQRLRWVFIEVNYIRANIAEELEGTVRAQYWHDGPRLWQMWQRVTYLKPSNKRRTLKKVWGELREPLADFPEHLGLFVREMSNLGKGDFLARQLLHERADWRLTLPEYLGPGLAGWRETGRGEEMIPENRIKFEKERAARLAEPAVHDLGDPVSQENLETMIAKVERLGATPVLIVPPMTGKKAFYPSPERAQKTMLLDFNDIVRFPELYESRHRLDWDHLNTAGAEIFTRLLAEHWIAAVKASAKGR
ncbi:MAG: hypothetical protein QOE70_5516 [Chthoniobacter sp.]|jgi:hypothetical protein|nr:hypothetical protein [Chthoniobacter sp.]